MRYGSLDLNILFELYPDKALSQLELIRRFEKKGLGFATQASLPHPVETSLRELTDLGPSYRPIIKKRGTKYSLTEEGRKIVGRFIMRNHEWRIRKILSHVIAICVLILLILGWFSC